MQLDWQSRQDNKDRFLAMAGFIILDDNADGPDRFSVNWAARNWVYRCFLEHVISFVQNDSELIDEMTFSMYGHSLDLDELAEEKPRLHTRVIDALNHTCDQIINGKCTLKNDGREMRKEAQVGFRGEIATLSQMLAANADKVARTQADVQQE